MSLRGCHKTDASIEPIIDAEYLLSNLDCGEFPNQAKSRISNTVPSAVRYPWALLLIRECYQNTLTPCGVCGATVITKK